MHYTKFNLILGDKGNIIINTIGDVKLFFSMLTDEFHLNFHPDTPFKDYEMIGSSEQVFTQIQADILDQLMEDCFSVCRREDVDIYGIGLEMLREYTDFDEPKGVWIGQIPMIWGVGLIVLGETHKECENALKEAFNRLKTRENKMGMNTAYYYADAMGQFGGSITHHEFGVAHRNMNCQIELMP